MAQIRVQRYRAGNGDPADRLISDEVVEVEDPPPPVPGSLEARLADIESRLSAVETSLGLL